MPKALFPALVGLCAAGVLQQPTVADDASQFHPPVRLKTVDHYIDTDIGHAAPWLHDFTGNGVRDLLVGQFGEGKLRIYRNVGTNESPEYAAHDWFKADHEYGTVPTG